MVDQLDTIEMLLNKRDYKRAEVQIARSLRANLDTSVRVRLLVARAKVRLKTARVDEALIDLQKVQSLHREAFEQPHVMELVGDCHLARFELATVGFADRADTAKARAVYEQVLNQHTQYPNIGWIRYQLGRVLLTEYRTEDAIACFQTALLEPSINPSLTALCYERLGFIAFYEQRLLDRALNLLNKAVGTYPVSEDNYWLVQVHILRSRVLRELRRMEEAVDAAQTAVQIASSSESKRGLPDALLSISETLSPLPNRERETILYLQHFVQISKKPLGIDVTWARVYEMMGDAHYHTSQYANALAAYEASFQYNPYTPWDMSLHYRLARSAYQLGEYQRALLAVERLIRSAEADDEPINDYRVFNLLGNSYYALNRFDDAIHAYEQALSFAPPDSPEIEQIRQYLRVASGLARRV